MHAFRLQLAFAALVVALVPAHAFYVGTPAGSRARATATRAPARLAASKASELVGFERFVRTNPRSDRFAVRAIDHLEFYCPDASLAASRFMCSLDMSPAGRFESDAHACSVAVQSGSVRLVFTAPAGVAPEPAIAQRTRAPAGFERQEARRLVSAHGTAVRAIGLSVDDCARAFDACVANGGRAVRPPTRMARAQDPERGEVEYAEVELYGNVVLRLLSAPADATQADGPAAREDPLALLPGYSSPGGLESGSPAEKSGPIPPLVRIDHVVGNVPALKEVWPYIARLTGFHPFAEFVAKDVGTVDSGLNSIVLASNCETVLLPLNEPTYNTRRKSQIQTYLEQHGGPGVQHIALLSPDIFATVRAMRGRVSRGGMGFMPRPSDAYYRGLPARLAASANAARAAAGDGGKDGALRGMGVSAAQLAEAEELGILVDRDEQGVLLQIFTVPVSDRKTLFLEVIQRLGCDDGEGGIVKGGCGGFGKGNFKELFKQVEDYLGDDL
ncbi:Glyoxalase/Bleomycin resistance protein/Dihydroxybiphenyl dioxygenase [Pavlovales sp. CCMP2436]|nr:Glyoxalase/Bleomycin resistance protein/Dihydroxybiphenyl dioxygenase [Pavlovales sp. CCMP2436]